ncbi:hypothetical protein [Arcticibacter sp.]|uniref:hypothetical protein n=1 Tax=Arcticibacter sp. TaxID=1872630 RepID=UPI00388E1018
MSLEEKADAYIKQSRHQLPLGGEESAKEDFKAGYLLAIKEATEAALSGFPHDKGKDLYEEIQSLNY